MKIKEVHAEAKRCIKPNFWKLFFIVILNCLITLAFSKVSDSFDTYIFKIIFLIISYVITVPLSYGVIVSFMKNSHGESISIFDFISDGMKSFKRVWCVFGRTILKLILPIIVLIIGSTVSFVLYYSSASQEPAGNAQIIISGIILIATTIYYIAKVISYSLTNYILYDSPELSAKEVVEESNIMMKGNKKSYIMIIIYIVVLYAVLLCAYSLIIAVLQNISGIIIGILLMLAGVVILLPYSIGLQIAFYNLLKNSESNNKTNE